MGRNQRPKPNQLSPQWSDSPLADPTHEAIRIYTLNLKKALAGTSIRAAAELTKVNHSTLAAILRGDAWPDAITVARTENGLNTRLWHSPITLPED